MAKASRSKTVDPAAAPVEAGAPVAERAVRGTKSAKSARSPRAARTPRAAKRTGPVLEPHQIVLRPRVTEKGTFQSSQFNRYTFEVCTTASKDDIKRAIERLFDVKVVGVATQSRKGKSRRYRFRVGKTKGWKKAIVRLHPDDRIDFF
jgi:large subunit ribosomal protein L23